LAFVTLNSRQEALTLVHADDEERLDGRTEWPAESHGHGRRVGDPCGGGIQSFNHICPRSSTKAWNAIPCASGPAG
jgi:hypothetical protein